MAEQSRRRWMVGVALTVVTMCGSALAYVPTHFEIRVRDGNPSTIAVASPSTGIAESAATERDARITLAGKWTSAADCNYAMMIKVRNGYIELRQAKPDEPLTDRHLIDGREGSGYVGIQEGITAKFSRDGDDLLYVRGGDETKFTRCG